MSVYISISFDTYQVLSGNFLGNLILGEEVILEADVQDKDNYGRLLRYVYVIDPVSGKTVFVNKEIYVGGYAEMMIIPPSDTRCGEINSSN